MTRPEYSTRLDTIIAGGNCRVAYRVLTVDVAWPEGEPPWDAGQRPLVPALPDEPPAYAPASFDTTVWTDCTALVAAYHYTQDAAMQMDQLSLSVPAGWTAVDLARVFREMRVIRVQERWWGAGEDTGWFDKCFCLSDGFAESWSSAGEHLYTVNAKDVLKLLALDPLGSGDGQQVFGADLARVDDGAGGAVALTLVAEAADAWEYGVVDANGALHPNWAERPAPQFWCANVPGVAEPIRLSVAGEAAQVVYGEGVLRLGKAYCEADPGEPPDYSAGLGFAIGVAPQVKALLYRYAHPAMEHRGATVTSDLVDACRVVSSSAGAVTLDADLSGKPVRLTLVAEDGSGARYATTGYTVVGGGQTVVYLARATVVVAPGTVARYGEGNRLTDVLTRLALSAGLQQVAEGDPFYLAPPSPPVVLGQSSELVLPPLVYRDEDEVTPAEAIELLRRDGWAPPNYLVRAMASGQVVCGSVAQLPDGDAGVLPVVAVHEIAMDRGDMFVATRVVARGERRQVEDVSRRAGVTIADVPAWAGGLPAPQSELRGMVVRANPTGESYVFDLTRLLQDLPVTSAEMRTLRPWGWYRHEGSTANADRLIGQWRGKALCEVVWPEPVQIDTLELNVSNPWLPAFAGGGKKGPSECWGGNFADLRTRAPLSQNARPAGATPQVLAAQYWDEQQQAWAWLASHVPARPVFPEVIRVSGEEFDTRGPVETTRLRLVCIEPGVVENATRDESWYHLIVGVWLSRVRVWSASQTRGMAALGETPPFHTAGWQAIARRLRRRTWVLPGVAPWASTQEAADWLALEWLKEKARDLAPRRLDAVRPDARLWDTVRVTLPGGRVEQLLLVGVDHRGVAGKPESHVSTLTGVNYSAPYVED